jgi:hypothetical protein
LGGGSGLGITAHWLEEDVTSTRCILRNLLSLDMQAGEWADYIHLVEVYSSGCSRLVRMLRADRGGQDRLFNYIREQTMLAIATAAKEFNLSV